jgi:hypothetical protein
VAEVGVESRKKQVGWRPVHCKENEQKVQNQIVDERLGMWKVTMRIWSGE